jgi:outer membrane protein assembly factor BamB
LRRIVLTRRIVLAVLVVGIMLASVAAGGLHYYRQRTGNVYHPDAPFIADPPPTLPTRRIARTAWPMYGFATNHARAFPASAGLRPPFHITWVRGGSALLEFPPALYGNSVFQLADDGVLLSLDKGTGRELWSRRLGVVSASTPAVANNTVFATVMQRRTGLNAGRIVALNATTGAIRWSRDLPSPSESSPLVDGHRVFFGSTDGTVYALSTDNGSVQWTYRAAGAVKASPTLAYGNLYFGDYSGHLQAVSERTGARVWVSGSGGKLFGSGQFYSTAAVVDGRVFLGNTDGRIYAYDASSGSLDWAVQTGAYVYSSPAVTDAPGLGPTVYSGSYDGTFYALSARSGHEQWTYRAGGRISGSATIIGHVVYFADLGSRTTIGLGISTGRQVFGGFPGSFDPVVTDGTRVYLTGYTGLFALTPRDEMHAAARTPAARATAAQPSSATTSALLGRLANGGRALSPAPPVVPPSPPYLPSTPGPEPAAVPAIVLPVPAPTPPPVPLRYAPSPGRCGVPAVTLLRAAAGDCGLVAAP